MCKGPGPIAVETVREGITIGATQVSSVPSERQRSPAATVIPLIVAQLAAVNLHRSPHGPQASEIALVAALCLGGRHGGGALDDFGILISDTYITEFPIAAGVVDQLHAADVAVTWLPGCIREDEGLYSHRREGVTGRFAGIIRLLPPESAA